MLKIQMMIIWKTSSKIKQMVRFKV